MINIGLLGCGTVGSGVVKLLQENRAAIEAKTNSQLSIVKVLELDRQKCLQSGIDDSIITDNIEEIINDESIDIVVELIGGSSLP